MSGYGSASQPALVSIVVPAYNAASFIRETIESLLAQTYQPIEIILIDDGSTDATASVLQTFGSRIRYECSSNLGAMAARNHGARIARGEWICFCDHDDIYLPSKIEKQMALAQAAAIDYVTCDFVDFSAAGVAARSHFSFAPNDFWGAVESFGPLGFVARDCLLGKLVRFQPNITASPLMRKSFFESVGRWDESLRYDPAEDTDFHFRCYALQKVRRPRGPVALSPSSHPGKLGRAPATHLYRRYVATHPAPLSPGAGPHRRDPVGHPGASPRDRPRCHPSAAVQDRPRAEPPP